MDRGPRRAAFVAAVAVAAWAILVGLRIAHPRLERAPGSRLARLARVSTLALAQWAVQMPLWFALPFFALACAWTPGQTVFLAVLAAGGAASLWDPLTAHLLARPVGASVLAALSSFAGLAAVLPGLGVSNAASLWLASAATGCGIVVLALAGAPTGRRVRAALVALVVAAALPAGLLVGAARVIPAAPLRLASAAIGTRMSGRELADPADSIRATRRLACATAVWAPAGLHDQLVHVWRHEGDVVDRIPLEVRGGRTEGFRTWSIKNHLGPDPRGRWACSVETASGQVLGSASVQIGEPEADGGTVSRSANRRSHPSARHPSCPSTCTGSPDP